MPNHCSEKGALTDLKLTTSAKPCDMKAGAQSIHSIKVDNTRAPSIYLVDLGFRLLLELIFSGVADFQLGAALHKDDRKKLTELVGNSALFKTIRVYFENAVRIRQVFPTVALATLSVWGAIQELAAKGTVSQT